MLVVTPEAQAPYLEQRFQVQQYRENDLNPVIIVVIRVPRFLIVFEAHRRSGNTVCQNCAHHHHAELRRPEDRLTDWGG